MIIVIGREFGSGGRQIGRMVAERLGIAYYDKELLSEAAGRLGFSPEVFAATDEKRPSPFRSLVQGLYGIADNFHTTSMSGERLYEQQSAVIRDLAERGPCVIVGRTADYIMRDNPCMVSVFLHAPIEWRAEKIVRRGDCMVLEKAKDVARGVDRDRENYYNYFTGQGWGRANNYHLTIDASKLPASKIADIIVDYATEVCRRKEGR
ncbi:MAG: cytidylate kinase-like family protein [Bacteroides sp.]|nr:cytidylate kinase-like family protein [Bacteroides sp.]